MSRKEERAPFIVFAVTIAASAGFYRGQIQYLRQQGYRVGIVCSPGDIGTMDAERYEVPMEREISVLKDIVSLWRLILLFRRIRPDVINAGTPKAGLLCSIAAFLTRIPVRIYTMHGLRHETLRGFKRRLMIQMERVAVACVHQVLCVSHSLREQAAAFGIARRTKSTVIHHGSCSGVRIEDYTLNESRLMDAKKIRSTLGIPDKAKVFGFVGRLTKDKGVEELVAAFDSICANQEECYLLLCGEYEAGDPISPSTKELIEGHPRILAPGYVSPVLPYYLSMDVFVFPSYREGMSSANLEACASGLPVITSMATGCVDGVQDGVTGILVPIGDVNSIREAMEYMLRHPEEVRLMGQRGRERVERDFQPLDIWRGHERLYDQLLHKRIDPVGADVSL
ncbi:glycosyltransferase family 4 protein [Paenibacillus marinisediminis]